jgi:RimJ/RimL family protein N-acetyltransferase
MADPVLRTDRLSLRRWRKEDEPSLLKYANNWNVAKNLRDRFPHPYTPKDAELWLGFAGGESPLLNFAVEVDSHAVGGISLMHNDDVFRLSAEVGYWLGEPYWGRGLATKALKLITDYAFSQFGLIRLEAGVFSTNPASGRVLEKAGYVFESRQRKAVIKQGQILDRLIYVRLRDPKL